MPNNNFSLEENGLAPKNYFIADSFFQYIPCFLGMTLSIDSILNLNKESDDFEILNNFKNSLIMTYPQYEQGINCCDYMYYYYCLKYMKPELMRNLEDNPELLENYFTINNDGNKQQLLYTYIKQVTIRDEPGTSYYIAIVDNIDNISTIVRKEYIVGASGIIQFYNSKIFGIIPKSLLDFSIENNNINYSIESTFLDIEDCPFQDEINEYYDSLSRVDMTITTSEISIDKIQNENWGIPYDLNPDDDPDSTDILTVYVKDAFIDQVCVFLVGQIGTKENTLLVFQDGSNVSYMSKNTCIWNYGQINESASANLVSYKDGQIMNNITSDKVISYQYGGVFPQYCEYYYSTSSDYLNETANWDIVIDSWPYYNYFTKCSFEIIVSWDTRDWIVNGEIIGTQVVPYISKLKVEASMGALRGHVVSKINDSSEIFLQWSDIIDSGTYGRLPCPKDTNNSPSSRSIIKSIPYFSNFNFSDLTSGQTMNFCFPEAAGSDDYISVRYCNNFLSAKDRVISAKNNNHTESNFFDATGVDASIYLFTQQYEYSFQSPEDQDARLPFYINRQNGEILTSRTYDIMIGPQGETEENIADGGYTDFTTKYYHF